MYVFINIGWLVVPTEDKEMTFVTQKTAYVCKYACKYCVSIRKLYKKNTFCENMTIFVYSSPHKKIQFAFDNLKIPNSWQ